MNSINITQLLDLAVSKNASDLHLLSGSLPMLRINGELVPVMGTTELTSGEIESLVFPLLSPLQKDILVNTWELDLGLEYEDRARFRVNCYKQKGSFAAAFRFIPKEIRKLDEIGLPTIVNKILDLPQGLILVTGPTGQGKSTTLAAFINQINLTRASHIITVEDPIEFVYPKAKSLISQRELNSDTKSWTNSLKSALREDPDVVLIGEMRDLDTISSAMTIAETGHLVFATLHTNSAAQTIDRIIDVFPENQQPQIRVQLGAVIEGIISQRLIPTITPGRALAAEVLLGNPALRSLIRENKTHLIDNLIQTSAEIGMMSLETSLAMLVKEGKITIETAQNFTLRPQLLRKLLSIN
jgi:twitching motility protein PilT